jgi:hypothetical protein
LISQSREEASEARDFLEQLLNSSAHQAAASKKRSGWSQEKKICRSKIKRSDKFSKLFVGETLVLPRSFFGQKIETEKNKTGWKPFFLL